MDHAGEEEVLDEDRVLLCNRRRVTFRSDSRNEVHRTAARCAANGKDVNGQIQQSTECCEQDDDEKKVCDVDKKKSSDNIVGILRPRSISPSPLTFQALMCTQPRFNHSKLFNAMRRSKETRVCIERLRKQIFQRFEHQQRHSKSNVVSTIPSQSKVWIENGENRPIPLVQEERRMLCLQRTKAMMKQSLPLSMLPFVEETLKAAHFLRRRRKENGHGRIIHQILIEQHERVLKELEQNNDRDGETSHHNSSQKS